MELLDGLAPHRQRPGRVTIQCIGVWDTVGALGIPGSRFCSHAYTFHETQLGPRVRHAFQALAIDEHRGNFQAAPWVPPEHPHVFEQVWFPGVHSNVGGGYEDHGLSDTTLLWMVSRIKQYNLLDLDIDCITSTLDQSSPYPTGKLVNSRSAFWVALGCAIPRPVLSTSNAEKIHASAFEYGQGVYRSRRRQAWLHAYEIAKVARNDFEKENAVKTKGPPAPLPSLGSSKLGWCDWIMQQVVGNT
jgi:hypothetical protein